jgi:hypothetical protein
VPAAYREAERQRINKIKQVWKELDEKSDLRPRCWYCGQNAEVCVSCMSQKAEMPNHVLQPVMIKGAHVGRCADHGGWKWGTAPRAFYGAKMSDLVPHACLSCLERNPWREEDHVQVTGFSYERMSFSFPLSPSNVVRVNHWRFIRVGEAPPAPSVRAAEAQAAYEKEMAFSGDVDWANWCKNRILSPSDGTVW